MLVRAHRLWETYLNQVGTPAEELHERAHELEHLHDPATVAYLDDKLGHPLKDPHGATIPEDAQACAPGAEVRVSLLREGRTATVTALEEPALDSGMAIGMQIRVGPRSRDGQQWNLIVPDGRVFCLDHRTADAVMVRIEASPDEPQLPD